MPHVSEEDKSGVTGLALCIFHLSPELMQHCLLHTVLTVNATQPSDSERGQGVARVER